MSFYFARDKYLCLYLKIEIEEWNESFSFKDFFEKIESNLRHDHIITLVSKSINEALEESLIFEIKIIDYSKSVKDLCDSILMTLKARFNLAIIELRYNRINLTNTFTFPPEIQSSCEQYLIYFATFLKDIGIHAETNIESKAQSTLFTVTPANGEEALEKIKEALHVYLSLPESPEFENVVTEYSDIGVQQLASQVYFLKSQLLMANSAIQMKDATIQSLNMTNYQQTITIESHQATEKNEEKIVGGLVKVNEVKVKGFTFDLPEFLRRIKRNFK